MLPRVRAERETQVVGKSKSELMKVIDTLQRVNLNSVGETLIAVIDVAVFSSVDRQKLLVIVQSRQSGDDDDSGLSVLDGAVSYHSQGSDTPTVAHEVRILQETVNAGAEQSERLVWSWTRQTAVHGLSTPRERDHFSDSSRQANTRVEHHMVQKCTKIAEGYQHMHATHQDTHAGCR